MAWTALTRTPNVPPVTSNGANAATVLPLAEFVFGEEAAIGTLLFVNDGFDASDVQKLTEYTSRDGTASVVAFVVGTDEGGVALMPDGSAVMDPGGGRLDTSVDRGVLKRVQSSARVPIVRAETGDGDLRQLLRRIESNLQRADDPNAQWRDQAWWFTWPSALLALLWFRRGWTMQW